MLATLAILLCGCSGLIADEPAFEVSKTATLTKHPQATYYVVEFDLGELPSNETGNVELVVNNPFSETITFKDTRSQCNCAKIEFDSTQIAAGESTTFRIRLSTPTKSEHGISQGAVKLVHEDQPIVRVGFKYNLGGMLAMSTGMTVLDVPNDEDFGLVKVSFLATKPLVLDQLEIEKSDSLRDIDFRLVEEDGKFYVVGDVHRHLLEAGPISGEVRVSDPASGRRDGFFCTAKIASPIRISPTVLRFRSAPKNGGYESTALLRLLQKRQHRKADESKSSNVSPGGLKIVAKAGANKFQTKTRKIAENIYRIRIIAESKEFEGEIPESLDWFLTHDGKEYALSTPLMWND
jgi:hypothetical protein